MAVAIVYGSSMGNTEEVAKVLADKLGAEVLDIANTDSDTINSFDKLILGSSTWGSGDLQDDWDAFDLDSINFSGKTVALFGFGDQQSYSDEFCNAMGILYEKAKNGGANLVGSWPTDGYDFEESEAVKDGKFVGLALDNDNQEDLTEERISNWVAQIKPNFS